MDDYSIKNFYKKHKYIILFNKNIFVAAIITAILDIFIVNHAALVFTTNYVLISSVSLAADFSIYNASFIILYFIDNTGRSQNFDRRKNIQKLRYSLGKIITVIGFAEISYLFAKFLSTYLIFEFVILDAFIISIITTLFAWIFYVIIANIMARRKKLFN
ncbi:MAG TPA: hypothetical protein VK250_08000 [Nitrososphaeraceae archaeon]|nr:hypothetical protein [Nitrososphaeraceae archaeon]